MSRNFWIGLVASFAVLALAIGALVLTKQVTGPDLALPDTMDGYVAADSEEAFERLDEDRRAEARERTADQRDYVEDEFSAALGDADVAYRTYVALQTDGASFVGVLAAATDTGPLLPEGGFQDPAAAGLSLPQVERVEEGDVECLLRRINPPRADADYTEEDALPSSLLCQRTSGSLSVRVSSGSGATVEQIAGYVNDLYDDLD